MVGKTVEEEEETGAEEVDGEGARVKEGELEDMIDPFESIDTTNAAPRIHRSMA